MNMCDDYGDYLAEKYPDGAQIPPAKPGTLAYVIEQRVMIPMMCDIMRPSPLIEMMLREKREG